ncbi:hypothetical protein LAZ67_13002970 [Cordylochernes scorpioides]|uniref:VWFA domain-containing protein n=1 Tax=Cordylochernes scorpioides TaxID=51811 RepID=A0ABY6L9N0_9ARAC|nr:hypothetical protein LAZ67_13002970 [Cordylochernes scorpioides]
MVGPNCKFIPDPTSKARASIMYIPDIHMVDSFCEDSEGALEHNTLAPTKQNSRCNYKSTWTIISRHQDFTKLRRRPANDDTRPNFIIVRQDSSSIVLVLDVSTSMKGKFVEMLHRATKRFIADRVPDGAKLGLVKFSTDASVVSPLTKVDNTTRVRLLSQIPNFADGWTAIGKGLNTGLQSQGGMIVLVTDGEENRDPRIVDVTPSIQKAGVTVNSVAFGDKASIHLEQLIKATGGVGYYFNTTENTTAKIDMAFLSSMTSQYDVKEQPVTVKQWKNATSFRRPYQNTSKPQAPAPRYYQNTSKPQAPTPRYYQDKPLPQVLNERVSVTPQSPTLRSFYMDSQLGGLTTFTFTSPAINQVQVRLMSSQGRLYEAGSPEYLFDQANQQIKIILLKAESGRWFAEIKSSGFSYVSWVVTSVPKDPKNQPVRIKSWIGDLELTFPTVARVYAQVSKRYEPVLGAHIVATIDRPMGSLVDIVLLDNGAGADGTRDDGIYSAYFTQFNGDGRYSVVAQVVNNGQAGVRIKRRSLLSRSPPLPKPSHPFDTLGIQIEKIQSMCLEKEGTTGFPLEDFIRREDEMPEEDPRNLLEDFERSAFTGAFRVQAFPKDGIDRDVFPPCPVTDLRVTKINRDVVSLRWTSPGDDLDYGNVSSIEVRFGENLKALLKNFTSSKIVVEKDLVDGTLDPPPPGHYHEISIKVPVSLEEPKTVFFAVVGVDASGNRAESFSIFPANLGKLGRDPSNFTLAWKIGIAIILLVAVISIVLVALYFRRRQKDKIPSVAFSNS